MTAQLLGLIDPIKNISFALSKDNVFVVGGNLKCDLQITDEKVSDTHFQIYSEHDIFFIEDLGSSNGTYLNDCPIKSPIPLASKDLISIGNTQLQFIHKRSSRHSKTTRQEKKDGQPPTIPKTVCQNKDQKKKKDSAAYIPQTQWQDKEGGFEDPQQKPENKEGGFGNSQQKPNDKPSGTYVPKTEWEDRGENFELPKWEEERLQIELPIINQQIGEYHVIEHLGAGATGDVFKAKNINNDEHVTLKMLHAQDLDQETLQRFVQEVQTCAKLDHPKIIKVMDFAVYRERPLIIMEYVNGVSLEEYVKENGAFPARRALRILGQITEGIHYLHQQKIIHRDLKPNNILLQKEFNKIKIIDFGIIKVLGSSITTTNQTLGTIRYIPPEQIDDAASVDTSSDIYALGAVLYYLVSGRPPYYQLERLENLILGVATEPPIALPEIVENLSPSVCNIVEKAMNREREHRYQSTTEIFTALIAALKDIS